ncbi:MAG TPA: hypothetical protein VGZ00_09945 [Candidatus Baltobacteraceae bacterium]|nr:hypothetical protein [Candidatus Baltobacteraceae bacterium]
MLTLILLAFVSACGRQVTPNPTFGIGGSGSDLSGDMVIHYQTAAAYDLTNYNYVVVFNTSGAGGEPYANAWATSFKNYSYAFVVGANSANYGGLSLLEYYLPPGGGSLQWVQVQTNPALTQFTQNSNGNGNQFTIVFNRQQLNNPANIASPSPGPTATASPTPSPSPTLAPGVTPGPSPTPGPTASPTPFGATTWYVNFIVTDKNGIPVDALGPGGVNDTSVSYPIDITTNTDLQISVPIGYAQASSQTAQLSVSGNEIINYP